MGPFPWSKGGVGGRAKLGLRKVDKSGASTCQETKKVLKPVVKSGIRQQPSPTASRAPLLPLPLKASPPSRPSDLLPYFENSESLRELHAKCAELGCISFKIPSYGAVAGKVLQHASRELENLFAKESPLIFKIGYTHCAFWRWTNKVYGYAHARDRWSHMVVVFVAKEPYSPSFLEAALIDKFRSHLNAIL